MSKGTTGRVTVIGIGCGGAGMLTQRAVDLLRTGETLVSDGPVDGSIRVLAPRSAEWVFTGAVDRRPALTDREVCELLIARARGGRQVVRLINGDPCWFSDGMDLARELELASIPMEVVPGVTSLQAAAASAGVPVHDASGRTPLATVYGAPEAPEFWARFLVEGGTLVVLDPLPRFSAWTAELIAAGAPIAMPAVVVSHGGSPAARRVSGGLHEIAQLSDVAGIEGPALAVIGSSVKERRLLQAHLRRPLAGRRIVLTRTREQASEWRSRLEERGAEVLELPLIQVEFKAAKETADEVFAELGAYDWIVFTSANGVRGFLAQFFQRFRDLRSIGIARLAVVGEGTAAALREVHIEAELTSPKPDAVSLAEALVDTGSLDSAKVLVVTGNLNREDLVKRLNDARAIVDVFPVYETTAADLRRDAAAVAFRRSGADAIIFTSSSAVRSFVDQAGALAIEPHARKPLAVSIGPMTSAAMREFRLPVDVEAAEPSLDALTVALVRAFENR